MDERYNERRRDRSCAKEDVESRARAETRRRGRDGRRGVEGEAEAESRRGVRARGGLSDGSKEASGRGRRVDGEGVRGERREGRGRVRGPVSASSSRSRLGAHGRGESGTHPMSSSDSSLSSSFASSLASSAAPPAAAPPDEAPAAGAAPPAPTLLRGGKQSSSAHYARGGGSREGEADGREELLDVLALERLGEERGPDGLDLDVGSLSDGDDLVGLFVWEGGGRSRSQVGRARERGEERSTGQLDATRGR